MKLLLTLLFAQAILLATLLRPGADAACSATATPEGTYGGPEGRIMSDTDGVGRRNFGRYDNCTWFVKCPPGQSFAVDELDLDMYRGYDIVSFTDVDTNQRLKSFRSDFSNVRFMTAANHVMIRFDATASSLTDDGFTCNYVCYPMQCSAGIYGHFIGGMAFSDRFGLIASDTSGYYGYEQRTFESERCSWSITCPVELQKMTVWVRYRLANGAQLKLGDLATYSEWGSDKRVELPFVQAPTTKPLIVNFTSGVYASPGYSIAYTCSSGRCSSGNSSLITDATGRIVTDFDGSGSLYSYMANEQCSWTIQCPTGSDKFLFWDVRGSLGSGERMSINRSSTDESIYNNSATNSLYSRANILQLAAAETVSVTFDSDASSESNGFSVNYACRPTKCTSLQAGRVLTEPFGEILTDKDGHTGTSGSLNSYEIGEECMWNIQCPAEYSAGLSIALFGKTRNDFVRITESSGREAFYGRVGTLQGSWTLQSKPISIDVRSTGVSISFNTTTAEPGFTLQWICQRQPSCTSTNATGVTSSSGTLVTDADGAGSQYYFAPGENCSWSISCPASANASYVRLYTSGKAATSGGVTSSYGVTVYETSSKTDVLLSTTIDVCCRSSPVYVPASTAFVTFTTPQQSATSPRSLNTGVSIAWDCIQRKCPVDDGMVLTTKSGTIMTDRDGAGTKWRFVSGESCEWAIKCPAQFKNVFVRTFANAGRTCDESDANVLQVTDPMGPPAAVLKNCDFNAGRSRLFRNAGRLDVTWKTQGSLSGVTLDYECTNSVCLSGNTAIVEAKYGEVGTLMSDADGSQTSYTITSGELCSQRIQCTDGSPFIALAVEYRLPQGVKLNLGEKVLEGEGTRYGIYKTANVIVRGSSVDVVLNAENATYIDFTGGYTITYVCRRNYCSSVTAPSVVAEETSANVILGSSIRTGGDGGQLSSYLDGETCAWEASCPAKYSHMFFSVSQPIGPNASWSIRNASSNALVAAGDGTSGTSSTNGVSSMAYGTSSKVSFEATGLPSGSNNGIIVNFWCSTSNCQSIQSGKTYQDRASAIWSDGDGAGRLIKSVPGEICIFRLTCTQSKRIYITGFDAAMGGNVLQVFNNSNGASTLDAATMPVLASFSGNRTIGLGRYYVESGDVFFRYTVTEVANGFHFAPKCDEDAQKQCGAAVSENAAAGTLSFENAVGTNEGTCVVPFSCPSDRPNVRIYSDYKSQDWVLTLFGSGTNQHALNELFLFSWTGKFQGLLESPGQLSWAAQRTRSSYTDDIKLNMTCVASRCTSNVTTGVNVSVPTCKAGTTDCGKVVATDAFQNGKGGYISGEYCNWPMACPAGTFLHLLMRQRSWVYKTSDSFQMTLVTRESDTSADSFYPVSEGFKARGFYPGTSWGSLTAISKGTSTNSEGPSATVSCRSNRCDANELPHTNATGTIYFGATSTADYSMGVRCNFMVICPAGYNGIRFRGSGRRRSSLDRVYFDQMEQVDGAWVPLTLGYARIENAVSTYVNVRDTWPFWRIRFTSEFTTSTSTSVSPPKFTYECMSDAQTSIPVIPEPHPEPGPNQPPGPGPFSPPGPFPPPGPGPMPPPGPNPAAPSGGEGAGSSFGGTIAGSIVAGLVLVAAMVAGLSFFYRSKAASSAGGPEVLLTTDESSEMAEVGAKSIL